MQIPEHIVLKMACYGSGEIYWKEYCWPKKAGPVNECMTQREININNYYQINAFTDPDGKISERNLIEFIKEFKKELRG